MTTQQESVLLNPHEVITQYRLFDRVENYYSSLMELNQKINLVSRETNREGFTRMIAECLLPLEKISGVSESYLDIGSGGGLPAIPILFARKFSGEIKLIERTLKKTKALRSMLVALNLPGEVLPKTFEEIALTSKYDLITMRYVKLTLPLLKHLTGKLTDAGTFVYYASPEVKIPPHVEVETFHFKDGIGEANKSYTLIRKRG
ncbi:MAG: RsmG family class I SAM-dependent methyltransferase [candidate division Zixibacteria bacterium]|nr:RsmG family class I SAM-dependent methyltransferase [candidate division Zixibacteria bacterium]